MDAIPLTTSLTAPELLVELWERREQVLAWCRAHLHSHEQAEDACMETYIRLLKKIDTVTDHPSPYSWLIVAARNVCREHLRDEHWDVPLDDEDDAAGDPVSRRGIETLRQQGAQDDEAQRRIAREWIRELSPRLRQACELAIEGLRPVEIAAELGNTRDNVDVQISRAAKQLEARRQQMLDDR